MRIDVHAHYFPQSYVDLLIQCGRKDLAPFAVGQSTDFTERLKAMNDTRTDVQILSSIGLDTFVPDELGAVKACRYINDTYKAVIDKHGGRFGAFAQVPLPHIQSALAEAHRCLDELEFEGICTPCFYDGKPLDSPEFEAFWQDMNERKAVIYVHPVGTHSMCHHGLQQFGLHTAWGSPLQLSATATRLVYSGLTRRYPGLSFIFAVCGGYLPYMWSRIERNLRRGLSGSATAAVGDKMFAWVLKLGLDPKDPMAEFRKFYYDTSVQDLTEAMRCVKSSYGTERVLLGSDEIFASLVEAVQYIEDNAALTATEKRAILDENAQKLFQFPESRRYFKAAKATTV
jgi:predicted TIM-barrel fold metal-dependent hydrolase